MKQFFVPADFRIPEVLETDRFRLRPLIIKDLDKDYEAVISSLDHLQAHRVFGEKSSWPPADLTKEQNLKDLKWHQKEFQTRSSFTYTVMNLDETQCLGCVYIFPSKKEGFDAAVFMWVRESEYKKGLDTILFQTVKDWIEKDWPFKKVAYPGRE